MHFNMHHDMPDISFAGIFGPVKKIMIQIWPEKLVFISFNMNRFIQFSGINLNTAWIKKISEIH